MPFAGQYGFGPLVTYQAALGAGTAQRTNLSPDPRTSTAVSVFISNVLTIHTLATVKKESVKILQACGIRIHDIAIDICQAEEMILIMNSIPSTILDVGLLNAR